MITNDQSTDFIDHTPGYGANYKFVSPEQAEKCREILKEKLFNLNSVHDEEDSGYKTNDDAIKAAKVLRKKLEDNEKLDEEAMLAGVILSWFYVYSGILRFNLFARKMVYVLGYKIVPHLKFLYNTSRSCPEINNTSMCEYHEIADIDVDQMLRRQDQLERSLLEIAEEKLESLQHYPPDKNYSILGQLMNHLVFSQESAGDGTDLEQLVSLLSDQSEAAVINYLFYRGDYEERLEWITALLSKATTEEEIYEVMIDNLLEGAILEWSEPESQ